MTLLLDTHVFIWWREDSKKLKKQAREIIADADRVLISAISAWEIVIKTALGKMRFPGTLSQAITDSGFEHLPLSVEHVEGLQALARHHADPFDRMLIAQALWEDATLVTHDRSFAAYSARIHWT